LGSKTLYLALTIIAFIRRREEVWKYLDDNSINRTKYQRLILLSAVDTFVGFPLNMYLLIIRGMEEAKQPYVNWSFVHAGFTQIPEVPFEFWSMDPLTLMAIRLHEWVFIFCAVAFVVFYGTTKESISRIVTVFSALRGWCIRKDKLSKGDNVLPSTMPMVFQPGGQGKKFARYETQQK